MSSYTRFGCGIWSEDWFIELPYDARNLWWGLYTSAEARRVCPGLFHGSMIAMSEAARMPADDTYKALDHLLDRELVEFDTHARVLRLTRLPDGGEGPYNGNIVRGWFYRFQTVPRCQVRDAHVTMLRWVIDEFGRESKTGRVNEDVEKGWLETFAHPTKGIPMLAPRRRGVRRLCDNDTGTDLQPGLFDARSSASRSSVSDGSETVLPTPVCDPEEGSPSICNHRKDLSPETVSKRFGSGSGTGSSFLDPDPDPVAQPGEDLDQPTVSKKPRLALVPPHTPDLPYTPEELVAALSDGTGYQRQTVRELARNALVATIRELKAVGVVLGDLPAVGRWISRASNMPIRHLFAGSDPDEITSLWAATPGAVIAAHRQASEHARVASERSAFLAECMGQRPA